MDKNKTKTIKLDEEASIILGEFKRYGDYKTYSETIKALKRYLNSLLEYKRKYQELTNEQ